MVYNKAAARLIALGVSLGCSFAVAQLQAASSSTLPAELINADKVVQLQASKVSFSVTLQDNPTTGYNWFLWRYDRELLKPLKAKYSPPENPKMMGAPGRMTWTFRAQPLAFNVPTVTTVELLYARPWSLQGGKVYRIAVVTTR